MKNKKENFLNEALNYAQLGFSVIPIRPRSKNPYLVSWKEFQSRKATEEEIRKWWKQFPEANIGIVTGKISGVVVLDIEAEADLDAFLRQYPLPNTPCCRTGGGGRHYYFKYPLEAQISTRIKVLPNIDIKADKGYVLAPPSIHESGETYKWIVPLNTKEDLADIPGSSIFEREKEQPLNDWQAIMGGVEEGERNTKATELIGKLLAHLPQKDWESIAWPALRSWNLQNNKPPLPDDELRNVYKSIANREEDNEFAIENFIPLSFSELMAKEFEGATWIIDRLIPSGIIAISGSPAAYKTWLILNIALKVASGDILFDEFPTIQGNVLLIDEENGERLLQKRLKKMSQKFELPIYFLSWKGFRLGRESVDKIIAFTKEKNIKLIIFDSLVRIHGADENDATKMAGMFRWLQEFHKNGVSVIFTHHNRKLTGWRGGDLSQNMRGSSDILASVDCHLALEKKSKEEFIIVTQTKNRVEQEIKPFKLGILNDENSFSFEYLGETDEFKTKKEDCKEVIKEIFSREKEPLYQKQLLESLRGGGIQIGNSTLKESLKEMAERGEIFKKKGKGNTTYYSLKPFDEIV